MIHRPTLRRSAVAIVLLTAAALACAWLWGRRPAANGLAPLLKQVLKVHLRQHAVDAALTRRILHKFVEQLDPGKVFFLEAEAAAVSDLDEAALNALAAQTAQVRVAGLPRVGLRPPKVLLDQGFIR